MATSAPSNDQIQQTHLGLLQQATEYSRKLVAQRQAEATKLENEYNAIDRAGPRSAYFTARDNPNTDPAKVAELKAKYDAVKEYSGDVGDRLSRTNQLLEQTQDALASNELKYLEAKALAPTGTTTASPTIGATSNDPAAVATQNRVDNANSVPPGQQLNSNKTSVNSNTEGIPVRDEAGTLSTLKKSPDDGELYNPVPPPLESGLAIQNEDGTYSTSRRNPETGELYNPVPGSVAQREPIVTPEDVINDPYGVLAAEDEALREDAIAKEDAALYPSVTPISDPYGLLAAEDIAIADAEADEVEAYKHLSASPADPYGVLAAEDEAIADKISKEDAVLYNRLSTKTGAVNEAVSSNAKAGNKATTSEPDDWRVRLSLAPSANYLYRDSAIKSGDLLYPLINTNGVLFPYVPQIQTAYKASYDPAELVHSNYKMHFYKGSSVDDVTITADFTAQDTLEANYMLAVIHFFKSATKMFYGKDQSPRAGTPPPLLYLSGFGAYQFDKHPLLLSSFTYSLPNDVDYIRAGSTKTWGGTNISQLGSKAVNSSASTPLDRLLSSFKGKIAPGGTAPAPSFASALSGGDSTYVPTKIQIQITLIPVVTRNDISNNFSVEKYATGALSRGSKRPGGGGGIW